MSASASIEATKFVLQELEAISDPQARSAFVAARKDQWNLNTIVDLANHAREFLRIDARRSLNLGELAIEIAKVIGDKAATAHAIRIKANALHALGQYSSAVELHKEAVQLFDSAGDVAEVGRTLSASMLSLNLCGDYEAAFSAAERARVIFMQLGDELRLSRLEINTGNVFYRQDRFADALACYRRAYDGVIKHRNSEGIAAVLSNLSVCLISLGHFHEALETHQHARCDQPAHVAGPGCDHERGGEQQVGAEDDWSP